LYLYCCSIQARTRKAIKHRVHMYLCHSTSCYCFSCFFVADFVSENANVFCSCQIKNKRPCIWTDTRKTIGDWLLSEGSGNVCVCVCAYSGIGMECCKKWIEWVDEAPKAPWGLCNLDPECSGFWGGWAKAMAFELHIVSLLLYCHHFCCSSVLGVHCGICCPAESAWW
jgi:hypothetical protein